MYSPWFKKYTRRTYVISQLEELDVPGAVVGPPRRGALAHERQVGERRRRGPLVRPARHARQVEALHEAASLIRYLKSNFAFSLLVRII